MLQVALHSMKHSFHYPEDLLLLLHYEIPTCITSPISALKARSHALNSTCVSVVVAPPGGHTPNPTDHV